MKIKKSLLARLNKVYAVTAAEVSGKVCLIAASEANDKCLLFSSPEWQPSLIWNEPGGTMHIVQSSSYSKDSFFAIQKFYPVFKSENACIVYMEVINLENNNLAWKIKKISDLPFVHRLGVVNSDSGSYLIASTLCGGKKFTDDWSKPGAVYSCKIPDNPNEKWNLKTIIEGISKNHGMQITRFNDEQVILISGSEGVFCIKMPDQNSQWRYTRLIDHEVSDIYLSDIDDDGIEEIITIEPFHGDELVIYKFLYNIWKPVFSYDINFGHAVLGGKFLGEPGILIGNRGGEKDLILLRPLKYNPFVMSKIVIDKGGGPNQIAVIKNDDKNFILSAANGSTEEVVLYDLSE